MDRKKYKMQYYLFLEICEKYLLQNLFVYNCKNTPLFNNIKTSNVCNLI